MVCTHQTLTHTACHFLVTSSPESVTSLVAVLAALGVWAYREVRWAGGGRRGGRRSGEGGGGRRVGWGRESQVEGR